MIKFFFFLNFIIIKQLKLQEVVNWRLRCQMLEVLLVMAGIILHLVFLASKEKQLKDSLASSKNNSWIKGFLYATM